MMLGKTANQLYQEERRRRNLSRTQFSFSQWLDEQKKYGVDGKTSDSVFIINKTLNDSVQKVMQKSGYKTEESGKTIFGINKYLVIGGSIVLVGTIAYLLIKKTKS